MAGVTLLWWERRVANSIGWLRGISLHSNHIPEQEHWDTVYTACMTDHWTLSAPASAPTTAAGFCIWEFRSWCLKLGIKSNMDSGKDFEWLYLGSLMWASEATVTKAYKKLYSTKQWPCLNGEIIYYKYKSRITSKNKSYLESSAIMWGLLEPEGRMHPKVFSLWNLR